MSASREELKQRLEALYRRAIQRSGSSSKRRISDIDCPTCAEARAALTATKAPG